MANSKITELPATTLVDSVDVLPIVDISDGETKKVTTNQIKDFLTQSITSLPNLIVDPATNFTNFTSSVRNQFSEGPGIQITSGQISSIPLTSKLFIDSDTIIPHTTLPIAFQNSIGIPLELNIQETGLYKFEMCLMISCSAETHVDFDNNYLITTGSTTTAIISQSNFLFNNIGLQNIATLDQPPDFRTCLVPFPSLDPSFSSFGASLPNYRGAVCKIDGIAQVTTPGIIGYKLYSIEFTDNKLKIGSYFSAIKI